MLETPEKLSHGIIESVVDIWNRETRLLLYKCTLFIYLLLLLFFFFFFNARGGGAQNPQGELNAPTPL